MRRFALQRDTDISGISGPGTVVWGVQFPDGVCAYRWNTPTATTSIADSIADVEEIHGHNGATRVVWLDAECDRFEWDDLVRAADHARPAGDADGCSAA